MFSIYTKLLSGKRGSNMHYIMRAVAIVFFVLNTNAWANSNNYNFDTDQAQIEGQMLGDYAFNGIEMSIATVLYLDSPVTIKGNRQSEMKLNRKTVRKIDRVLLKASEEIILSEFHGKRVSLTGKFQNIASEAHHTLVEFMATDLAVIERDDETYEPNTVGTFRFKTE